MTWDEVGGVNLYFCVLPLFECEDRMCSGLSPGMMPDSSGATSDKDMEPDGGSRFLL
ncbi:protein of unknown function [Alcaligenes faecalis subsp. faecalis]|nr:protein of unknown function [Alcaligenes faecalis subsp. faecalis]